MPLTVNSVSGKSLCTPVRRLWCTSSSACPQPCIRLFLSLGSCSTHGMPLRDGLILTSGKQSLRKRSVQAQTAQLWWGRAQSKDS